MSRPRGRPNRKNAMDRENSEDILLEASSLLNPEMQGARRRLLSPVENGDYTLPMSSSQTGTITRNMERRRTLHEELGAVADQPVNKEVEESIENGSMTERYEELKLAFNNMRLESRQLQNRLDAAERHMDAFTSLLQEQIEDFENKMHAQVTEPVRSQRSMNEVRFQVLEGRLEDYRDREANFKDEEVRRNTESILRITDRQQRFEETLNQRNHYPLEPPTSSETLKITPKTPVFNGKGSHIDPSMVAYAIKNFRQVKGLVPSPTAKEIISKLARHFNEEIRSTVLGRPINNLEDLLELLERFDNAGPLNSRRSTPPNAHDNWRNKSSRDCLQYPRPSDDGGHPQRRCPGIPDGQPKFETWRKQIKTYFYANMRAY